jgi:ABC-type branched-subunit amino acid transport system ATPase component/ABC-type branched-subunit amino acid transport system permease subunit
VASGAVADLRAWPGAKPAAWIGAAWVAAIVALVRFADPLTLQRAALGVYLLIALYGLWLLVVQTNQPSLGHAGFLAAGAYLTAFLRLRLGLDGVSAAVIAMLAAGCLGWLVGIGSSRLRPPFVALSTWAFGWLVVISIGAFPSVSGGVAGINLRAPMSIRVDALGLLLRFSEAGHLVLASLILALVLIGLRSAEESWLGRAWAAMRSSAGLATSLGYDLVGMRRWTFFVAAALAGLSGSLAAQLLGVVDPTLYSASVSLGLFVAVMIGSRLGFFGPVLGLGVVGGLPLLAATVLPSASTAPVRGVAVAVLTVVALVLSLQNGRRPAHHGRPRDAPPLAALRPRRRPVAGGAPLLVATGLTRRFGGVHALASMDLTVLESELHAIIGPNGSGKSTLLKCLSGSIQADSGRVDLAGLSLDHLDERWRARAGLVRTFQRVVVMPDLTPSEHVQMGLRQRSANSGWLAALLRTPGYRDAALSGRQDAQRLLRVFGLSPWADADPVALSGAQQRMLQLATAVATGPRLLLLDEPAAGMGPEDVEGLATALFRLREMGLTIVVVDHNIAFVRRLADRVTVMHEGTTLSQGTPRQVVADPKVRAAYLGTAPQVVA